MKSFIKIVVFWAIVVFYGWMLMQPQEDSANAVAKVIAIGMFLYILPKIFSPKDLHN